MTPAAVSLIAAASVLASVLYRVVILSLYAQNPLEHFVNPLAIFGYSDVAASIDARFADRHWPYLTFPYAEQPLVGLGTALLSYVTTGATAVLVAWGVVLALAAAGVASLLARSAGTTRALVFWALSPQLLVLGGLNFDALPILALVAASLTPFPGPPVAASARLLSARPVAASASLLLGRPVAASASLAVGAAAKLVTALALPVLVASVARDSARRALLAAGAATAILALFYVPAILAPQSILGSTEHPWRAGFRIDSVWLAVAVALSPVADLAGVNAVVKPLSAVALVAGYVALCLVPALRGAAPAPLFWRAVAVALLVSPVYPLSASLWLLPALALYAPRARLLALLALGDLATFAAFNVLDTGVLGYPWLARAEPFRGLLLFGVLVRHAALALTLIALLHASPRHKGIG